MNTSTFCIYLDELVDTSRSSITPSYVIFLQVVRLVSVRGRQSRRFFQIWLGFHNVTVDEREERARSIQFFLDKQREREREEENPHMRRKGRSRNIAFKKKAATEGRFLR